MELGSRIRELRAKANLSQDELAKNVYVARQTISNWETNKTLPDLESLKLLAVTFDVSVDDLIGNDSAELRERSQGERHRALVLLGRNILWYGLYLALQVIQMIADGQGADEGALGIVLWGARIALGILWIRAWLQMRTYQQTHRLVNAAQLVAFIEGRDPHGKLPDDWLYAIVSHWVFWGVTAMTVLLLLLQWTGALG